LRFINVSKIDVYPEEHKELADPNRDAATQDNDDDNDNPEDND